MVHVRPQTPASCHRDLQCNTTGSSRRFGSGGKAPACVFHTLKKAFPSALFPVFVALVWPSSPEVNDNDWFPPLALPIGGSCLVALRGQT